MLQPCTNRNCSVHYAVGMPQCPACGAPAPIQDAPEPAPSIWTVRRIMLTLIATGIGGFPGAYWYAQTRWTPAAIICILGTFIGFALSLPGVSIGRVLSGTGGFVASRRSRKQLISEALNPDGTDPDALATDDRGRR